MSKSFLFFTMILSMVFLPFHPLFAQNSPPEQVEKIMQDMLVLERFYEMNRWDKARETANRIDNTLLKMLVTTDLEAPSLEKALVGLKGALFEADQKKSQVKYIIFQKRFVAFLNNFDHKVHPILRMIERSVIVESDAAVTNKDYFDVSTEMAEAGNLIKHAKPLLLAKGVSEEELAEFNSSILAIIKATKQNDDSLVLEELGKIQVLYRYFLTKAT